MLSEMLKKLSERKQRGVEKLNKFRSKIPGIKVIDKQVRKNMQGIQQINNLARPVNQQQEMLQTNSNIAKPLSTNISSKLQNIPKTPRTQEYTPEGKTKVSNDMMNLHFNKGKKSKGF